MLMATSLLFKLSFTNLIVSRAILIRQFLKNMICVPIVTDNLEDAIKDMAEASRLRILSCALII